MLLTEQIWMAQALRDTPNALLMLEEGELHQQVRVYGEIAQKLADEGFKTPDPEMFYAELEEGQQKRLDEAGYGLNWLREAKTMEVTDERTRFASARLRDSYLRSLIQDGAGRITKELALAQDAEDVVGLLTTIASDVQRVSSGAAELIMPTDLASLTLALIKQKHQRKASYKTKLPALDYWIGDGFEPGQLVTIGAWPSHGKSLILEMLCELLCAQNDLYAYFQDVELGEMTLTKRITKRITGKDFFSDRYSEKTSIDMVVGEMPRLDSSRIIAGMPGKTTLERIENLSRLAIQRGNASIIAWDGANRISVPGAFNTVDAVTTVTRRAKDFARENNVLVILTGQLLQTNAPQAGLPRRPEREDMKGAKSFIEDADHSFIVRRVDKKPCAGDIEEYGDGNTIESVKRRKGLTEILYAKDRHGGNEGARMLLNLNDRTLRYEEEPAW